MSLNEPEHSKHTALVRPAYGNFGHNEWAFLGAPCGDIKLLAQQVISALSPIAKIAYADALHSDEPDAAPAGMVAGAALEYTKKEGQTQVNYCGSLNPFANRVLFNNCDMVLLNGNHHQGKKQVVIIDSRKKASLQKRINQLKDVGIFLLAGSETELFNFVKEAIPGWQQIPVYRIDETDKIVWFFKSALAHFKPALNALVLAGGQSRRMGQDKGAISWHGKDQRYYLADLLKNYTSKVYISCRTDQQQEIDAAYLTLPDTFTGLGPFGAILSAFREQPEKAWLVVACDLPLLDAATLNFLVSNRDTSAIATAFKNVDNNFPEPLITIWEPKSYPVLLSFLSQGYSCPRKVLINSNTHSLQAPNARALTNVNTPEEMAQAKISLQQKTMPA